MEAKKLILTSSHEWNKNTKIELVLDNNNNIIKDIWYTKKDPITDFVDKFYLIYNFFGVHESIYINNILAFALYENKDKETFDKDMVDKIFEYIYDIEIPQNIKFIKFERCMCNMGNCNAITDMNFFSANTIRDLMEQISYIDEETLKYVYPDGVWFDMKYIYKLPKIHPGDCDLPEVEPDQSLLDLKHFKYITTSYVR